MPGRPSGLQPRTSALTNAKLEPVSSRSRHFRLRPDAPRPRARYVNGYNRLQRAVTGSMAISAIDLAPRKQSIKFYIIYSFSCIDEIVAIDDAARERSRRARVAALTLP